MGNIFSFRPALDRFKRKPEYMGFILIVIIIALNIVMQGSAFFRSSSMQTLFSTATPLVVLTMAQCIVMISGNIDISSGITMSLVNVFAVMMPVHVPGLPVWAAYIIGYSLAVLIGFINGVLIGYFRIPPMLATYAMSFIVRGFNLLISDRPQGKVARELWGIYKGNVFGIPNTAFFILALIFVWFYIKRLPLFKELYAAGGDEKATYLTGISTVRTTIRAYTISGIYVGIAGLCWTLMLASSNPINGDIKTLQSVAAALIGGTLISGGWGTMVCGVLGAFFMTFVNNASSYMFTKFIPSFIPGFSVSSYYQEFVGQLITMFGIILAIVMSARTRSTQSGAVKSALRITENKGGQK
jgi:ribose/xylose/arabinose/galactoside ABC-type transport system permease subunit